MIHLKIQTEYSFGAVYAPLSQLINRLKEINCTHAAMVDADTWGHVRFYNACKKAGIVPLLGCSAIVTDSDDITPRMWFIAKNQAGLSELYQALSKSYHQKVPTARGAYPRLYQSDIIAMSDNIFKFAGDITDGEFLASLTNCYIDIIENGSNLVNRMKKAIIRDYHLQGVGVWDNAYISPDDKDLLDFLPYGGSSNRDLSLTDKLTIGQDVALSIAKQCEGLELPVAPMIQMQGDIEALCRAAIPERFPNGWMPEYEKRLQHELTEIKAKNFDSYFLLVRDMVKFAKSKMLVGPSRGSAAGSLVCYLLHITEIDPLPAELIFERFIDRTRKDLPDIDLDFPDNKRELVIDYLKDKWGAEHVAHVGNIAVFKPRSALVQVCKKLDIPPLASAAVKAAVIERAESDPRFNLCLYDTLKETDAGKQFLKLYPHAEVAAKLEGHAVRTGVHAAGILVCNAPLSRYCVVDDQNIAHIDKRDIEQVNLLKIDVLGLRTLTVLEDCQIAGIDWYHLPLNDPKAYAVFNSNKLSGIFQFEGRAIRDLAKRIAFKTIADIDALTALGRPGPLETGIAYKWIDYHNGAPCSILPQLRPLLGDNYGLPLYQEDSMRIVHDIGGFDWDLTGFVRKAISKSMGREKFAPLKPQFIAGAKQHGLTEADASALWEQIVAMGGYQMNKAHTRSYATVSYWTAWLKGNYPLQFAAATLRHAKDDDSAIELLREFCREGYQYAFFDAELSREDWAVIDGRLIGGFKALNGVGDISAKKYVAKRDSGELTTETLQRLLKKGSVFKDVLYITHTYGSYYDGCERVKGDVLQLAQIPEGLPHGAERIFIAELVSKTERDRNEDILIKKRGGVRDTSKHTKFLDVRLRDDSGAIGGRVAPRLYDTIGRQLNALPEGSIILFRAMFLHGIRYAFISKIKVLEVKE